MRINADPALDQRRRDALLLKFEDPTFVAEQTARLRAAVALAAERPDFQERKREHGRRQAREVLSRPEVRARARSPEARARAGRATTERRLGWCPPHLRDEYKDLIRRKLVPAAEARRIIEAQIPGTIEHAKRTVANNDIKMRLKHERDLAQAY